MRKQPNGIIYSPSDITTFIESKFSSWMDRHDLEQPGAYEADVVDESDKLIQDKGSLHEKRVLEILEREYGRVVTIPSEGNFETRHRLTIEAMHSGSPVIYQAALQKPPFAGYADFLIRVEGKSRLGDYHYEAWDSKLARSTKPYFITQLLCYSEMLDSIQGIFPKNIVVVLGTLERKQLRSNEFFDYYLSVKNNFLAFQKAFDPMNRPIPRKSEEIRNWSNEANALLLQLDHLSQVANIRESQINKLELSGIKTLNDLAQTKVTKIAGMDQGTFNRLQKQAELQLKSKGLKVPVFQLQQHGKGERKGLANLPPFSEGDIYFDMEGFPLFEDKGLEYLFGLIVHEGAETKFVDFWAHNRIQEKKAFEGFIDFVYGRFKQYLDLHIYHYAAYEVSALRRLSVTHATREFEVDELLRNEVFVDLYKIVTQALVIGEPSYSIKYVEHLYMDKREGEVVNAGASIVEYAQYLETPDGSDWTTSKSLKSIRDYNEVDCVSTLKLTQWLRKLQEKEKLTYLPAKQKFESEEREVFVNESEQLALKLLKPLDGKIELTEDERVRKLIAELLQFYRRKKKHYFWAYFDRVTLSHLELTEDKECIGAINISGTPEKDKRSMVCSYTFDPNQDIKYKANTTVTLLEDQDHAGSATITELNAEAGTISLKLGPTALPRFTSGFPKFASILPGPPVPTKVLEDAILSIAKNLDAEQGITSLPSALRDFLLRLPPKATGLTTGQAIQLDDISKLQNSTLCIQGPPGAGKTYSASHAILTLLKKGKKVGIMSNSHHAIENLMLGAIKVAKQDNLASKIYKSGGDEKDELLKLGVQYIDSKSIVNIASDANGAYLVGATAWGFAREELLNQFDYLFIDEAGQVAIANLVAVSRCAKNLVLLGDQRQLEQPTQGAHPGESGESCLTYLMQDHLTIPKELGVFLETTHRMRPSVCKFVSDYFYESRLHSDKKTLNNELFLSPTADLVKQSEGISFVPELRGDCSQSNPYEVETILKIISELKLGSIKENGKTRSITDDDILVVAPYNLQVNLLGDSLPKNVKVGTVDKFQGSEAPIAILSICASSLENAARGVEFLFSPNRLNVAISRAKCLAVIVGNPKLQNTKATSVKSMQLLNNFCGLKNASLEKYEK